MKNNKDKVVIANMSGFYGDRFSAAREMVEGGPVGFLTGDYLAELTMAILYKSKSKKPELGYAVSFLKQMEGIMATCLDKNIKVVVNAGGLNPSGLSNALTHLAATLKVHPIVAYIEGDNLIPRLPELVRQELSNCIFRQSYFSSDQGGKTGIMPKHNEDFSNAEQEEKNKYKCASISFLTH